MSFARLFRYILAEMLPVFLLGNLVFVFILLMFQALRLTEFVLIHGVSSYDVLRITLYLSISFLPAILPMSLLFAVLMAYGRLSNDSEIVAMKSVGLGMKYIATPALCFGVLATVLAAKTAFEMAPWGNRQFEVLVNDIGSQKAAVSIREGTFTDGFFEMVIYANKVNSATGELAGVFIFNERRKNTPVTIIAKNGKIITDEESKGEFALLRLRNGSIHRQTDSHTRIKFDTYDMQLYEPSETSFKEKSMQSLTLQEVKNRLAKREQLSDDEALKLEKEYHKRWAVSLACFIFALIGVGLGTTTNKRSGKSGGLILSVTLVIAYWIVYVSFENMAGQQLPVAAAIWLPNIIFGGAGALTLIRNWN